MDGTTTVGETISGQLLSFSLFLEGSEEADYSAVMTEVMDQAADAVLQRHAPIFRPDLITRQSPTNSTVWRTVFALLAMIS